MSKKDNLLQIIQLLTASEKKHFKQYISVRKDSKFYEALFDLLQKQDEYDVAKLSKKLKKTTKQVSDAKDYLMQVLLKSLESFHIETTPTIRVNNLLSQAEIARTKGIPMLAFDLLDKAEIICERFDYFLPLVAIYKQRHSAYAVQYNFSESFNANLKIDQYLIMEKNLVEYRDLHKKIHYMVLPKKDKSIDLSIEYFRDHPLLKDPSNALSITAKTFYYRTLITYNNWFGEKAKGYQLAKELYEIIKENPTKFDGNDYVKGGCLIDCVPGFIDPVPYPEFYEALGDIESLAMKVKPYDRVYYYQLLGGIAQYRQLCNTNLGHFSEGVSYYSRLMDDRSEFENIPHVMKALFLFESAFCFYFDGKPGMAAKLINELEEMKIKVLSAGRTFMRLRVLLAMIAFDDNNSVTMDSQLTAAKRHARECDFGVQELNHIHKTMTRLLSARLSKSEVDTIVEKTKVLIRGKERLSFLELFRFDQWVRHRAAR